MTQEHTAREPRAYTADAVTPNEEGGLEYRDPTNDAAWIWTDSPATTRC